MKKVLCICVWLLVISCSTDANNIMNSGDDGPQGVDRSENRKNVGDAAAQLLSADEFPSIVLELYYVDGFKPTNSTIANFEEFIRARLNKPGNIDLRLNAVASPGNRVYSIADIRNFEDQIRTMYNSAGEIAVYGIFLDGEYSENTENSSVLGVAYRNTSFAIFEETIGQFSNRPLAPSKTTLETTVLNHEFGHLLGLVNAGTPMQSQHQDVEHGRHCTVEDCLMYWTAETGEGLLSSLTGGTVPSLDAQCLADLSANGGK